MKSYMTAINALLPIGSKIDYTDDGIEVKLNKSHFHPTPSILRSIPGASQKLLIKFMGLKKSFQPVSDNFVHDVFNNIYEANHTHKMKLALTKLDTLAKSLSIYNPNALRRVHYAMRIIFSRGYLTYGSYKSKCEEYEITDIDKHIIKDGNTVIYKEFIKREEYIWGRLSTYNTQVNNGKPAVNNSKPVVDNGNTQVNDNNTQVNNSKPVVNNSNLLDDVQRSVLNDVLHTNLSVITGGPGTGKSTIIGEILNLVEDVYVLSFTGCAVENIQDRFPQYKEKCLTLHSFYRNKSLPPAGNLPITYVIDEFSMVDVSIFYKFLQKINQRDRIILCGDPDQLPSIKWGTLLKDIILKRTIPIHKLTKCYRSNDGIIKVLDYMKKYKKLATYTNVLEFFQYNDLDSIGLSFGQYNDKNTVILAPTNDTVDQINEEVQKLNPNPIIHNSNKWGKSTKIKLNDRVVFLKNNYEYKIYNGTILYIQDVQVDPELYLLDITFKNSKGELRHFKCDSDEFSDYVRLAYCVTIHKSQGREYDNVYLVLNKFPVPMQTSNILITAISRAKNKCLISGFTNEITRALLINTL